MARRFRKKGNTITQPKTKHRVNERILSPQLRVVDEKGDFMGIMSRDEALEKAKNLDIDLVEIAAKAVPPVAKIIDYGKMLYSLKKKEQKMQKASKTKEIKGIRITFRIGVGDLERQRLQAEKFLSEGHPVRIQMSMRGRERAHSGLAVEKTQKFVETLQDIATVEQPPKSSGFQIITILKPTITQK